MDSFIVTLRRQVRDLLRTEMQSAPTYGHLPDDVAHVPCLVVGRPTIGESGIPAVMTMRLEVLVLGRRLNDNDAQAELDAIADETFDVLGATRGTKLDGGSQLLSCTEVRPLSVIVAGLEYPAYALSVDYDIITC